MEKIKQLVSYIKEHQKEPVSYQTLANTIGVDRSNLITTIKRLEKNNVISKKTIFDKQNNQLLNVYEIKDASNYE